MQNHDRILLETIRRENTGYFDESWEILDQAVGDLTRHNRAMLHLGNSNREAKPLQVD